MAFQSQYCKPALFLFSELMTLFDDCPYPSSCKIKIWILSMSYLYVLEFQIDKPSLDSVSHLWETIILLKCRKTVLIIESSQRLIHGF